MGIIVFIIMIFVVSKMMGKALGESAKVSGDNMGNNWGSGTYQPPRPATRVESARAKLERQAERIVQENTARVKQSILERAKANAEEDKVDVTLESMEAEHNHSERVAPAVHHHPEDVITESMLGNIEDLMIKGYDGNLCFERDFLGEGLDMISRFSYQ